MLNQCPKSEALAKAKRTKKKEEDVSTPIPVFTTEQLDKMMDESAVHQEILHMRHKGVSPFQARLMKEAVTADVVDAVRWHDQRIEQLETMKLQDADKSNPWIDEVTEDFIAFGVSPSNTQDEAKTILKELDKELEAKSEAGFGPDARNYIHELRRELELLIDKL